jgi:beta-mannosidase
MAPERAAATARPRVVAIGDTQIDALNANWTAVAVPAGAAADPSSLATLIRDPDRIPAHAPGTAASALRDAGLLDWNRLRDFDADDWWFHCNFNAPGHDDGRRRVLRFDGLATLADVWLNGRHVLSSDNMWLAHDVDATGALSKSNDLVIRCASLTAAMSARRPRPRWRTRIVEQQQLRWMRATLLGRMPGWTPPAAPVGPWRAVRLETHGAISIDDVVLRPVVTGDNGSLAATIAVTHARGAKVTATVHCAGQSKTLAVAADANGSRLSGQLSVPRVRMWWPHTHGEPALHDVLLRVDVDGTTHEAQLGRVGFRSIVADRGADGKGFGLRVNGEPVFARGACWAPLDALTLDGRADSYDAAIAQARAAGFNMLRVSGTMAYECDAFFDACDAHGMLVWQDFMFANMDYPADDERFAQSVHDEATQLLRRIAHRPSVAVLCGGSEMAQQAAMLGLPRESWPHPLCDRLLPELCNAFAAQVPYVTNSPSGGALPFLVNEGVGHYYGVGAYLRPLEDARRAGVRFTTECLGFANVPEPRTVERVVTPSEPPPHHPRWKARVPRDRGAGWDFDDVRDHYFSVVFGTDPARVRYADVERYLALSRVATGEVMARTMAEWRRPRSECRGALVWMHRDLWPGAGWGVIDSDGTPKAAYWYLARACAPVALLATDEGVNGLAYHAVNDTPAAIDAELVITLWRDRTSVASGKAPLALAARSAQTVSADAVLGAFTDIAYAYRFGPPGHDLVTASLRDAHSGSTLSDWFHFPTGMPSAPRAELGVSADAWPADDGSWTLAVQCDAPALAVALDIPGFVPSDAYFHVAPGARKAITLRGAVSGTKPSGSVQPLNAAEPTRLTLHERAPAAQTSA